MLKLFLVAINLMASVSAIYWNDNMCQIYTNVNNFIMLNDIKKDTVNSIIHLPHSSYMKLEKVVQVLYSHNDYKAMEIELLDPTIADNCPYRITSGRNLAENCGSYWDCNSCMILSACEWYSGGCNQAADHSKLWYNKIPLCSSRYGVPKEQSCPEFIYSSYSDTYTVKFPDSYPSIPANTYCELLLKNPNRRQMDLTVYKYYVN